jgi:hypothetical protein
MIPLLRDCEGGQGAVRRGGGTKPCGLCGMMPDAAEVAAVNRPGDDEELAARLAGWQWDICLTAGRAEFVVRRRGQEGPPGAGT